MRPCQAVSLSEDNGHRVRCNQGLEKANLDAGDHLCRARRPASTWPARPRWRGISSKYYADCKPQASNKESYDVDVARRLWEVSQELTGAEAAVPVLSSS